MAKVKLKAFTPQRIAKLVKSPGTRAMIPTRLLPAEYQDARRAARKAKAPILPGSSITNRDLARQTRDASTLRYGAQDAALLRQTREQAGRNSDMQGWYGQYLKDLQDHAANVNAIGQTATDTLGRYGQQMQGLDQGNQAMQNQAASRIGGLVGSQAIGSAPMNQQAAAVRGNVLGTFVAGQTAANAANSTYADTLAKVVAPGQKLQAGAAGQKAMADLGQKRTDLEAEKGAYARNFQDTVKAGEAKSILAAQVAAGNNATKLGVAKINASKPSGKTPPVPWYTWSQWNALSPAEKRAAVKDYKRSGKTGTTTKPGSKDKPATPTQQGSAADGVGYALTIARQLKKTGTSAGDARQTLLNGDPGGAQYKIDKKTGKKVPDHYSDGRPVVNRKIKPTNSLWTDVAIDIAYRGGISPANVRRLHARGINIGKLGYPTLTQLRPPVGGNVGVGGPATGVLK